MNDCSYKKIYNLVAQTSLIHFQFRQSGSTLIAIEVKSKLDKFMIEKAKRNSVYDSA